MMAGNLHNEQQAISSDNKPAKTSVPNNTSSQAMLQTTPISTSPGKSRIGNVSQNIKPSLQTSLSLPVDTGIIGHGTHHTKTGNNLLTSSDENDSSNNSSASISTSNTPPNELSFNFSSEISKSEMYLNSPMHGSSHFIYSPEQQPKLNHSETSRSLSDIFGRRFATGSSAGTCVY